MHSMKTTSISNRDKAFLKSRGILPSQAEKQLQRFKLGFPFVKLVKPCTIQEGVLKLTAKEQGRAEAVFNQMLLRKKAVKFVPASGAASRMFHFLQEAKPEFEDLKKTFLKNLPRFSFYEDLKVVLHKQGHDIQSLRRKHKIEPILQALLESSGLGYRQTPKGLILFHGKGKSKRTAFQEQLSEALLFSSGKVTQVHFTLPAETRGEAQKHLKQATRLFKNTRFILTDSIQSPATDCLAADHAGAPVRDERGEILLRPAGHGALLNNLNRIHADLIYVKNIDNILPQSKRREADRWKRILSGFFLEMQAELFQAQKVLSQKKISPAQALQVLRLAEKFGWRGQGRKELASFLNRPLRVGGVVANTGEPGGGPFWIRNEQGLSPQIVESAEVNFKSKQQELIWRSSTHFNPVEFVCGVCDFRGKKYNLMDFADQERGLISRKNYLGREIRVMELPGLWNGGMGNWLTVFVEIPGTVFAPVKTVLDLLRKEHQVKK